MKQVLGEIGGRLLGKTVAGDDQPLYTDNSRKLDMGFPMEHTSRKVGSIWGERLGALGGPPEPAGPDGMDRLIASGFFDPKPSLHGAPPVKPNPKGRGRGPTIW